MTEAAKKKRRNTSAKGADLEARVVTELHFTVYGPPVGKQRARVTARGTFTPKATRDYEQRVRTQAAKALGAREWFDNAPMRVQCAVYFADERRRDLDNVGKAVTDALNTAIYADDSQIVELHLKKFIDRENPRVDVTVTAMGVTNGR